MNHFVSILLLLFCFSSLSAQGYEGCASGDEVVLPQNDTWEQEVLRLVNKERQKRGMEPLRAKKSLTLAARYHAVDMAQEGYFEHDSFDRNSKGRLKRVCDVFERMEAFDEDSSAENIAAGQTSPQEVVRTWMESSGHRENILDRSAQYLGVGYAYQVGDKFGHYWVQVFGW